MTAATADDITLRDGTPGDVDAIANLHAASWQETYRGLMPDAYLDGPVIQDRKTLWQRRLIDPPKGAILTVAERGEAAVGFIYLYPDPDHSGWMMLDNLHIHADMRGHGLGRRLMQAAAARLAELGETQVLLYVLAGNDGACRFYERLGGTAGPVEGHTIAGFANMPSIPYRWHDFAKVAKVAG